MFNDRVRSERAPATPALGPLKARAFEALGKPDGLLGVWLAGHRDYVGGRWLELSRHQTDFMIKMGLRPEHVLLDVGCGSLRGGVEFISYLHAGNYLGLDSSNRLIQAGIKEELWRRLLKLHSPEVVFSPPFEFEKVLKTSDFQPPPSTFTP